ncbi:MAG: hypothetical protein AAGM22_03870 [Acidobacteriota bacterium]
MSDYSESENSGGVREARRGVGERAAKFRDGYASVQENLAHASDDLGDYVRQNPGFAVLVAAGLGFLIGMILRGRGGD